MSTSQARIASEFLVAKIFKSLVQLIVQVTKMVMWFLVSLNGSFGYQVFFSPWPNFGLLDNEQLETHSYISSQCSSKKWVPWTAWYDGLPETWISSVKNSNNLEKMSVITPSITTRNSIFLKHDDQLFKSPCNEILKMDVFQRSIGYSVGNEW